MRRPGLSVFLLLPLALLLGCKSQATGTIQLVTDDDAGTFTQTPVPTEILVDVTNADGGQPVQIGSAPYPTSTIDLGNQDQDGVAQILVNATDSNRHALVMGGSVGLQYGALEGETLPLFVQRIGQTARLPNGPSGDARQSPWLSVLSDRFLLVGGGSDATLSDTVDVYDFAQLELLTPAVTLTYVPTTIAVSGIIGFMIDTTGAGHYYDFSGSTSASTVTAPSGFTFADVAGGQVIYDENGYIYVVGATRARTPTQAVLVINTNDTTTNSAYEIGNMWFAQLQASRAGAAAAWLPEFGLVVAGGNLSPGQGGSSSDSGVEVFDVVSNQTLSTALPYPPDYSAGAAMTPLDPSHLLLAGGILPSGADPGARKILVGCATNCTPTPWWPNGGLLPFPVTSSYAFYVDAADAVLIGSEPPGGKTPGLTHVFSLNTSGATEVPTRVPHTNAAAIDSPVASASMPVPPILIFGGSQGGEIESVLPPLP